VTGSGTANQPQAELLGVADIRVLANRLGLRPTKALGQNFVHDANTIRRITRIADLAPEDVVLEVGPGLGSLTLGLLDTGARVVAVEVDPRLAAALPDTIRQRAPGLANDLKVIAGDARKLSTPLDPPPTALVANLPYNVAVPVLLYLLELLPSIRHGLVLLQAEVADRLAAPPGGRAYGGPTVKTAWYAQAERAGAVPRSVFWPVPNVDSGLVRLVRTEPPALPAEVHRADVFAVIDAAFAQRRKMLRSALAAWAGSATAAESVLVRAQVDPRARAETLDVAAFARIASART
jgi:16S rRNA (adenine1518-N6/adenine1519-N6)-dimethyltransferase